MPGISNILIAGTFGPGAIENFYEKGFEKCGVTVTRFEIAAPYYDAIYKNIFNRLINKLSPAIFYKPVNEGILAFLDRKKFDVILVFKGMQLFPETIVQMKRHAALLVNYNCDHPFRFFSPGAGNSNVLNSIPHFDIHFSYSRHIVTQLERDYKKKAYCVPFGYDSDSGYTLTASPAYAERFLFIGAYDEERAAYLEKLRAENLDIYGDTKWNTRNHLRPYVKKAYRERSLYGNDYVSAVHGASGIINLLRPQNIVESSHNMRTFEVPGYGGLLISERTEEQETFFEDGKEAVFFEGPEELKDKMTFLGRNKSITNKIKQAGYNRSVSCKYSYNERSKQLLDFLQQHF